MAWKRSSSLHEKQTWNFLAKASIFGKLEVLEFQVVGMPAANLSRQLKTTNYLRVVA